MIEPISDTLTVGSILHVRAEFNVNKPAEIKLLTESDIPAFFITVEVDGSTVKYGNDRTQFTKILTNQLSTGEIYEYFIKVTSNGYAATFNGDQLELTLFTKTNWQCMDKDTDYPGCDLKAQTSTGIEDCYKKCKDLADCQSFMIVYDDSAFSQDPLNNCWSKSKKYGNGAVTLAGLKAGNMDCFIDNRNVTKLQGGGTLFNKVELSLIKVEYVFTQTTGNIGEWDGGATSGYIYTMIGSAG
ncbi:uncharacterized protein LOC134812339 [Bolinopsis microptera]|uniref:uncharacterized protein LOC134812339 n=1 Tax=Bolinopsis microptera TaxID=2820187 RepID=UPI003079134B